MATCKMIGHGVMPDAAWNGETLHVVWGQTPVVWAQFSADGVELSRQTRPVGYYPKTNGRDVVYSDGARYVGWLGPLALPGFAAGNHPVAIAPNGAVFHLTADGVLCGSVRVAAYRPTGIWEAHDDASVVMWDHAYGRFPWAALSHVCGGVAVGEGLQGGIEGRINGNPFHLNGAAPSFQPRVAVWGGKVAIVWCDYTQSPSQVWLWLGGDNELRDTTISVEPEAEPVVPYPQLAPAQEEPMVLMAPVRAVLAAFAEKFPLTMRDSDEDARREWTWKLVQTLAARFPAMGWGTKKADANRPLSKDSIALMSNGVLFGWDVQVAQGDGTLKVNLDPHGEDITGQVFWEVPPYDHLTPITPLPVPPITPEPGPQPDPTPTPDPQPYPLPVPDDGDVLALVRAANAKLDRIIAAMRGM